MQKQKKYGDKEKVVSVLIIIVLVLLAIFIFSIGNMGRGTKPMQLGTNSSQLVKSAEENKGIEQQNIILPNLEIRQDEKVRQYEKIETHLFSIYNTETNQQCKLSDGILQFESVMETLNKFLENHLYNILSIGIVDNKLYIQIDTSVKLDAKLKVKIVSLKEGFSPDDWFALTEAIYNSVDVKADSLFSYQTNYGIKHYIYVYSER